MVVELINTGSELMLGRVLNTHQQWLCRQLADLGCMVSRQTAVPDTGVDIQAAVRESLARAQIVITTGGLGPTSDDITRDLIAQLLGRALKEDASVIQKIRGYFEARNRPMPQSTAVQAMVPEGAAVLENQFGTAPGLLIEIRPNPFRADGSCSWLIMLPGPPRELRPMFTMQVAPIIRSLLPPSAQLVCRTLRSSGLGESLVEERVAKPLQQLVERGLEIGYCARPGQVDVRLVGRGETAKSLVSEGEKVVRELLTRHIYGVEDAEMEEGLVAELSARKQTLAIAESCTGGLISHRITNVPGASAVLLAGVVTYSNEAKRKFLGVQEATLTTHGAVSEAVAREMAEGARCATGATYGLSATGVAGPSGGSESKPVGTVFIGLAGPFPTVVVRNLNSSDRETFKQMTAQQAVELLRRSLQPKESP